MLRFKLLRLRPSLIDNSIGLPLIGDAESLRWIVNRFPRRGFPSNVPTLIGGEPDLDRCFITRSVGWLYSCTHYGRRILSIVITQGISVILIFAQLFRWITSWSVVSDLFTERV